MSESQTQSIMQQLLSRLKEDNRTSSEIARLSAVSQSTVSRLRQSSSVRQRITAPFNKLCRFYNISVPAFGKARQDYSELLREAIIEAWDGTEAGGRALLVVIRGLKELKQSDETAGEPLDHI